MWDDVSQRIEAEEEEVNFCIRCSRIPLIKNYFRMTAEELLEEIFNLATSFIFCLETSLETHLKGLNCQTMPQYSQILIKEI